MKGRAFYSRTVALATAPPSPELQFCLFRHSGRAYLQPSIAPQQGVCRRRCIPTAYRHFYCSTMGIFQGECQHVAERILCKIFSTHTHGAQAMFLRRHSDCVEPCINQAAHCCRSSNVSSIPIFDQYIFNTAVRRSAISSIFHHSNDNQRMAIVPQTEMSKKYPCVRSVVVETDRCSRL